MIIIRNKSFFLILTLAFTFIVKADSHLYLGLQNYLGNPALFHVKYNSTTGYTSGAYEVMDGTIENIALYTTAGNQGGVFINTDNGSVKYLREYSYDGSDFVYLRQLWQDITDLKVGPGNKLYGFEKTNGFLMYYVGNGSSFAYPAWTSYGAGTDGMFAVGTDGWIILDTDNSPAPGSYNWLATWSCNGTNFAYHDVNAKNFLPIAMALSPQNSSVWMAWYTAGDGYKLCQYVYGSQSPAGEPRPYQVASRTQTNMRDIAVRADGICIGTNTNYNGSPSLMAFKSTPLPGAGSISILGYTTLNSAMLTIDPDGSTIHTISNDGMLRAWSFNTGNNTFSLLFSLSIGSAGTAISASSNNPQPLPPIEDPCPWLTLEDITPAGQYYEANVPDTLDLAERGRIAVRGLTNFLNPNDDYSQYLHIYYNTNPPYMTNYYGQGKNNWGKIAEATIMARKMCGSSENLDIELNTLKGMMRFVSLTDPIPTPMSCIMNSLMTLYKDSPEPNLLAEIQAMATAHTNLAVDAGTYAYYWNGSPDYTDSMLGVIGYGWHTFIHGRAMRALSEWYEMSNDSRALITDGKLNNFITKTTFWETEAAPKAVVRSEHGHFMGHHHSFCNGLMGILYYAKITNNAKLKEFVRGGYEYLRNFGISRIGLFGEMCTTGDMTMLAICLSDWGVGDYWDDVDCYVRNQLVELQYIDPVKMQNVCSTMPALNPAQAAPAVDDFDDVLNRCVGVYLSDGSHPALIPEHTLLGVLCCTGNCTRALYGAWEGIVRYKNGAAQINLLLNRASPWLDIDSYLPYEGKVVIKNKTAGKISVRIPKWVDRNAITCKVNQNSVSPDWVGNYLDINHLSSNDAITIEFPMVETTEKHTLLWKEDDFWKESTNPNNNWQPENPPDVFTCRFKGNTLVDISPRPQRIGYPLYQRTYYDVNAAPTISVTRFVETQTYNPGGCIPRPSADMNNDCKVDFNDYAIISNQWLNCGLADQEQCW